jgi:chromosome segregation ATPase
MVSPGGSFGAIAAAAVDAAFRVKAMAATKPTVLAERIIAVESENNKLSTAITLKDVELAAQKAELEEVKALKTQLMHDLDDAREQIRDFQEQRSLLADLEIEIDRCSAQLLEKDSAIEQLQKQNAKQSAKIIQQDADLDDLASEFAKAQDEFDIKMSEMKGSLTAKESDCTKLKDEVAECRGLIQEFEPLLTSQQDYQAVLDERNSLLQRISELESDIKRANDDQILASDNTTALEMEIEARNLRIAELNKQMEVKEGDFCQKLREIEESGQKRERELQDEIARATAVLATALNGSGGEETLMRQISFKDRQLHEAHEAFRQVTGMVDSIEDEMREMARQYEELKAENDTLKLQIAQAHETNT